MMVATSTAPNSASIEGWSVSRCLMTTSISLACVVYCSITLLTINLGTWF